MASDLLNDEDRRRRFFYAEADAGFYDATIERVVPQYRLMHDTLIALARSRLERTGTPMSFLDVGSGTGMESIRLLREVPQARVVALDLCAPMHDQFRRNVSGALPNDASAAQRCELVLGDILGGAGEKSELRARLRRGEPGYAVALSAFVFHHFSSHDKHEAYRRMFAVLAPGGVLINGDLFTFESPELAAAAHEFDLTFIRESFDAAARANELLAAESARLRDEWIRHYQCEHQLQSIAAQAEMLRAIGFRAVEAPFRSGQLGILWAVK